MNLNCLRCVITAVAVLSPSLRPASAQDGLIAHWKRSGDCKDHSGNDHHAVNHGVNFVVPEGALFNGVDAWLEVPISKALRLGKRPFSVAVWIHTETELDDVLGDVLSQYDPATRTGVTLSMMNYAGVTSAQPNWRNVFFGIDASSMPATMT